jgi:hypothetical protein
MGSLRDETIARLTGDKANPEATIDGVKKQTQDMDAIDQAMSSARKLSGAKTLQEEIDRKDQKLEKVEQQRDKAIEDKHKAEIEKVETALGAKIDNLAKSYIGGASKESIADQIGEIKRAATELNIGGSKISEIREIMNLITTLNPQKTLADQIKDTKELINIIAPSDKGKEFSLGGMPATIALELKKMDTNLQITLENMKDERQRKDQEFQIMVKKWDDEKAMKMQEIQGKIAVEREKSEMFAGALQTLGKAAGEAYAENLTKGGAAAVRSSAQETYGIRLGESEQGTFECPHCKSPIGVGPTSVNARCVRCGGVYPISRIPRPATTPAAESIEQTEVGAVAEEE